MKYKDVANNKEINAYLKKGDANLGTMGFTEVIYIKSYKTELLYLCNM